MNPIEFNYKKLRIAQDLNKKTLLPELETEIAKLITINKILTDWLLYGGRKTPVDEASKTRFDQFCILAPFAITDIEPLTGGKGQ